MIVQFLSKCWRMPFRKTAFAGMPISSICQIFTYDDASGELSFSYSPLANYQPIFSFLLLPTSAIFHDILRLTPRVKLGRMLERLAGILPRMIDQHLRNRRLEGMIRIRLA